MALTLLERLDPLISQHRLSGASHSPLCFLILLPLSYLLEPFMPCPQRLQPQLDLTQSRLKHFPAPRQGYHSRISHELLANTTLLM